MKHFWIVYEPMINALVDLFHPFLEVAVHDLSEGKIAAIYHNISKRKVGQTSPLTELNVEIDQFPDYFPPYYKRNWDGRPLKCTSITIREAVGGAPIGLICFNFDAGLAQEGLNFLESLLRARPQGENPIHIFGGQCEESIETMIQKYLKEHSLSQYHITREQKEDIVQHLYHKGCFNFKNAVPTVATLLNLSRATVYNYLKKIGEV